MKPLVHFEHNTGTIESLFVTLMRLPSQVITKTQQLACRVQNVRGAFHRWQGFDCMASELK